ncbi:hypothetical protein RUM43_009765 [Polyplax serrata]|uniref:Uncharacterized protein n=1 Tax=Polyplax serrata TaxID=468196 RepID=A0AAN8P383_POLSC
MSKSFKSLIVPCVPNFTSVNPMIREATQKNFTLTNWAKKPKYNPHFRKVFVSGSRSGQGHRRGATRVKRRRKRGGLNASNSHYNFPSLESLR